jgi:hypothetical protein
MNTNDYYGLYLFPKKEAKQPCLKEMLQFIRWQSQGKQVSFSYIECDNTLHPHLSLWENLQVVRGHKDWKDFSRSIETEFKPMLELIQDPSRTAAKAEKWERLVVSMLRSATTSSPNVLVDIDENDYSSFNVLNFKKMLSVLAQKKNICLATKNISLWLDCAHSMVGRKGYEFTIESLDQQKIKIPRIA